MIIEELKIGNTSIFIDDTYFPQSDEENNRRWKEVEIIANQIYKSQLTATERTRGNVDE